MNTYQKYQPNVYLAKCTEKHAKGDIIIVQTKYGKENESIVFNLIYEKDNFYYYSIIRADGFNAQERAKLKAEKYHDWSERAKKKADQYSNASHDETKHIPMGQPILVGHHSEARHRRAIEKSWNYLGKAVEFTDKANNHDQKAEYWEQKTEDINLSMPESIGYFTTLLKNAEEYHQNLKNGTLPRKHAFSLTYAKKEVNELRKKLELAKKLWE